MVKISHYEIYTDRGDGWKLEDRFSSDQRYEAMRIAKEREAEKVSVKLLKEDFDIQDNSYIETVEYVSLAGKKGKTGSDYSLKGGLSASRSGEYNIETQEPAGPVNGQNVITAIFKLVAIIVFCLISANILVTLLIPVIEITVPEKLRQTVMFLTFFILFLLFAVPLVLRKVPWYVFSSNKVRRKKIIHEKKFFDKADAIIQIYNLNDSYEPTLAPAFPEAPAEFKRSIVDYMSQIISNLDGEVNISDNFNRLGVKLIIYGGVLELSRYNGLSITHANSMLHEAFGILDGDIADVEAFYEAKKTYKDNKVAVFLTGVGAYLMAQLLTNKPLDTHVLKKTFAKWEALNKYIVADNRISTKKEKQPSEPDILLKCFVGIENRVRFYENDQPGDKEDFARIKSEVSNIIADLSDKYDGENVKEDNYITSIEFTKLNNAAHFALEFFKNISVYEDKLNNTNLIVADKCCILSVPPEQEEKMALYLQDVLEQTFDNEIIVNEEVQKQLQGEKYEFEFLGEKVLNKTGASEALYKMAEQ